MAQIEKLRFVPSSNNDLWIRNQNSRRVYGENDSISYKRVLEWKERNPGIFMSVKSGDRLVAGVTLMPLEESIIHAIINNRMVERDIPLWSIKQWQDEQLSVYCPSIAIVASGNRKVDAIRGRFLIKESIQWALSLQHLYDIKNWYGIAATNKGAAIMEKVGFTRLTDETEEGQQTLEKIGLRLIPTHRRGYVLDNPMSPSHMLKQLTGKMKV